jgi:uncharacterized protein
MMKCEQSSNRTRSYHTTMNAYLSIYYMHGFGSGPNSTTLKLLQSHYPAAIGPTYDHCNPERSLATLTDILKNDHDDKCIVGSSLGGWYAEQLSNTIAADFVLYNPQTEPHIGLAKYGVDEEHLQKYNRLQSSFLSKPASRTVILSTDDDVVPHSVAYEKYKEKASVVLTQGGHRMTVSNMLLIVNTISSLGGTTGAVRN